MDPKERKNLWSIRAQFWKTSVNINTAATGQNRMFSTRSLPSPVIKGRTSKVPNAGIGFSGLVS
jgi:hypothetical protein